MLVLTRKETFRVDSENEGQRFIEEEKEKEVRRFRLHTIG